MSTFTIDNTKTVGTLKASFYNLFGGVLHVLNNGKIEDEKTVLSSIGSRSGDVRYTETTCVNTFIENVSMQCNLNIKIYTKDEWAEIDKRINIIQIKLLPKCTNREMMEHAVSMGMRLTKVSRIKGLPIDYRINVKELMYYNDKWKNLSNYVEQENALDLLFNEYTKNESLSQILLKIASLNDFYSTNIFDIYTVAHHYHTMDIDNRLEKGDVSLVNDLANVKLKNGKPRDFYSFASKYCSHHKPNKYPLYDRYVDDVLKELRKREEFLEFRNKDLKCFNIFKKAIDDCIDFYKLIDPNTGIPFTYKQVDRYLWLLGKDYFYAYE